MNQIKKQIKINASAEDVMKFISKPKNMEVVIPNVIRNFNISKGNPRAGFGFDWEFSMAGIPFYGKWKIEEYDLSKKYVAISTGKINSKWTYTFTEKNGVTTWKVTIEYEPPKKVMAKLAQGVIEKMNEKDAETFLHNVKAILEQ